MSDGRQKRRFFSAPALLLLVALLALVVLTTAQAFKSHGPHLVVARGVVDGSFHPIAGRFKPDGTKLGDCTTDPRCLEQAFGNLAYAGGPRAALALFIQRQSTDRAVATDCHRIAHMIGSASLAYFKGSVAQAYSHGSASCASGYYHGILERAFASVNSQGGLVRVARSICKGAGVRRMGFLDYQCVHGLGHGLMIQTGYDLPTALWVCGQLQTRWDEISCTGGVFMENGSTVYGMRSQWLKDSNPTYPCAVVKLRNRASCYLRVTTQMLRVNHFNWPDTAARCHALAATWIRYCFRSFGRDAANATGANVSSTLRICSLTGAVQGDCLYGAARSIADRDASTTKAGTLCREAPRAEQGQCFAGVGVVVGLLQPSAKKRSEACAKLTRRSQRACATAATLEVDPSGRGAWG